MYKENKIINGVSPKEFIDWLHGKYPDASHDFEEFKQYLSDKRKQNKKLQKQGKSSFSDKRKQNKKLQKQGKLERR